MTVTTAQPGSGNANKAAFEFVQILAQELTSGKVELPSFPDIAIKVRKVLSDDDVNLDYGGAGCGLRTDAGGPPAADRQLRGGKPHRQPGYRYAQGGAAHGSEHGAQRRDRLRDGSDEEGRRSQGTGGSQWRRCGNVVQPWPPCRHVVARRLTKLNPDTALLAGLLHGVGELYILTRAHKHQTLFADRPVYDAIVREWHVSVAKALLENGKFPKISSRPSVNSRTSTAAIPDRRICRTCSPWRT